MATSRPFAYNTASISTGVSASFGNLSVGFVSQSYSAGSGLKWYNGPDEESGYVIGTSLPSGGKVSPDGTTGNVTFWRAPDFANSNFISLSNKITGQNFSDIASAKTWLNSNGYFVSDSLTPVYSLLVGGTFSTSSAPNSREFMAKLNSDFSVDTNFVNSGSGFDTYITKFVAQPDGKILIVGGFTTYNGVSANAIIRLNSDGSRDTDFNVGTGFDGTTQTVALQPDGKILVGGGFTTYKGTSSNKIIRLDSSGSIDTTFNIGTGFGANVIYSIIVQPDGKILAGGGFTTYQGTTRNRIVRLTNSGSYDTDFTIGTGFNNDVNILCLQPDGKIVAGGLFTTYQGTTRNRIVRLTNSGSYDTDFTIGTGFDSTIYGLSLQPDGKILAAGFFSTYSGSTANKAARLNISGSHDSTFNTVTGFNDYTNILISQPNGKILAAGSFTTYNNVSSSRIISLNTDGTIDNTLSSFSPNNAVQWLDVYYS